MKVRSGFVTNSSSTNFLIISKEELTTEYLMKKLGFAPNSKLLNTGYSLAKDILNGAHSGLRWFNFDEINYEAVLEVFGEESAKKYLELDKQGFFTYLGHTNSDDDYLTAFMTMDNFVIDDKDFYMDGINCVW
jgi:hypothetical protein